MNNNQKLDKSEMYDLFPIISALDNAITQYGGNNIPDKITIDLKTELNQLFNNEPSANSLVISNNLDKAFFGVILRPVMDVEEIVRGDDLRDIHPVKYYSIDIDSKLFSSSMTTREIVSLILYDIYTIMDTQSFRDSAAAIDYICAGRKEKINSAVINYRCIKDLLGYCIGDYLYRSRSIFAKTRFDIVEVPQLLKAYGLADDFITALDRIGELKNETLNTLPSPALALNWAFSVINIYEPRSLYAIKVLESSMKCTGSTLMKNVLKTMIDNFTTTNINSQRDAARGIHEGSLFAGIRKNGLKTLENDLYEYEMRIKNIDDENSAIFLMRQINSRMGIIADYVDEEKLSDMERKRWESLYDQYGKLRLKMTNKSIYSKKMYGLFVDYNALMQPGPENQMTMNTVY